MNTKKLLRMAGVAGFLVLALSVYGENREAAKEYTQKKFSANFQNTDIKAALYALAEKANMRININGAVAGRVSYTFENTTLENALKTMANDHNLDYTLAGDMITVSKEGGETGPQSGSVHVIRLKYTDATNIISNLKSLLGVNAAIFADQENNAVVLNGSQSDFQKARQYLNAFDTLPRQVLIEAQIIETTKNFARDIGIAAGDLTNTSQTIGGRVSGYMASAMPKTPNVGFKYLLGTLDGRALDLRLQAAETSGDAKTISRPKIVTLNRRAAFINSGIQYYVRTLTTLSATQTQTGSTTNSTSPTTTTGSGSNTLTGGVQQIQAGLKIMVTPVIIGEKSVRLDINITNSEPDHASASVDGIPGIVDNSASTAIIVEDGHIAIIAGLMKNSLSSTDTGVPLLKDIPILGWLFKGNQKAERNTELVILMTPTILDHSITPTKDAGL